MSENAETSVTDDRSGERPAGRRRLRSFDAAKARARVAGVVATVVRWGGTLAAAILAAHVVLTVGNGNPDNGIVRFVADWADPLALGLGNLFLFPADPRLETLVNYGIAAVFWLVITSIAVRIVRAFG